MLDGAPASTAEGKLLTVLQWHWLFSMLVPLFVYPYLLFNPFSCWRSREALQAGQTQYRVWGLGRRLQRQVARWLRPAAGLAVLGVAATLGFLVFLLVSQNADFGRHCTPVRRGGELYSVLKAGTGEAGVDPVFVLWNATAGRGVQNATAGVLHGGHWTVAELGNLGMNLYRIAVSFLGVHLLGALYFVFQTCAAKCAKSDS